MIKLPNTRKGKPFPSCGLGLDSAFCQTWEPCSLLMSHFRIALDCLEPSRVGTKKVPGNMCCDLVENPKNIKPTWVGTNETGLQILQEQVGCWCCGQRQVAKNWQGVPRMLAGWRVQLMLVTKLRLEWTSGKVLTSLRTKKVKSWTCEKCGKVLVFHSFTSLLFSDIYLCVLHWQDESFQSTDCCMHLRSGWKKHELIIIGLNEPPLAARLKKSSCTGL